MSRFCFCNCPAGFSAEPERHAPDCPGRSGAGKARTPVPATTPAVKVTAAEELDTVLHWRTKHAQAIKERDGLQISLNTADQSIDELNAAISRRTHRVRELEALLTAADERADVLEADVREKECLLLKCMEAFNNCVGMSSQATRSKWYEVYLKPVSGSVLVHFSKGIQRAFGKPAESDDTTIEEERDDAKKVFVRTNTKQGQSISLDDMLARYERKP